MEQHELERIARAALKELGVPRADLSVAPDTTPGHWQIHIKGNALGPATLRVRCGAGTTAQWVREQIVEQYLR